MKGQNGPKGEAGGDSPNPGSKLNNTGEYEGEKLMTHDENKNISQQGKENEEAKETEPPANGKNLNGGAAAK